MPIVIAGSLAFWISLVLYAHRHPRWKHHGAPPRTEVAGGAFMAVDGGRQLEPIPGHSVHEIPVPRAAAAEESYEGADLGATGTAGPEAAAEAAPEEAAESQRAGIGLPPA
ncbi:MAG TPA: hypothetical protein VMB74_02520 [Streptosporangiaceae bacterium]|nr:hypothetical protein [Streptosporangiaceae bacterium]